MHWPSSWTAVDVFNVLSALAIILGVPAGLWRYIHVTRDEHRQQRERLYTELNLRFIEYQKLCLQHPKLDVADTPDPHPEPLSPLEKRQEETMIVILFNLFESAFLLYRDADREVWKKQWRGWDRYIRFYLSRPNFYRAWLAGMPTGAGSTDNTFDEDFEAYMTGICRAHPVPDAVAAGAHLST